MRKTKGITINGEYLGNSVVINGMFRAICAISPVIMRDFILVLNSIDALNAPIKIKNFNCGNNCIDIVFIKNEDVEGEGEEGNAKLVFSATNDSIILENYELNLSDKKNIKSNETCTQKITAHDNTREEQDNESVKENTNINILQNEENELKSEQINQQLSAREALIEKKKKIAEARKKLKQPADNIVADNNYNQNLKDDTVEDSLQTEIEKIEENKQATKEIAPKNDENIVEQVVNNKKTNKEELNGQDRKKELDVEAKDTILQGSDVSPNAQNEQSFESDNIFEEEQHVLEENDTSSEKISKENLKNDSPSDDFNEIEESSIQKKETQSKIIDDSTSIDNVSTNNEVEFIEEETSQKKTSVDIINDDELSNMSDEELAELEAQIDAELSDNEEVFTKEIKEKLNEDFSTAETGDTKFKLSDSTSSEESHNTYTIIAKTIRMEIVNSEGSTSNLPQEWLTNSGNSNSIVNTGSAESFGQNFEIGAGVAQGNMQNMNFANNTGFQNVPQGINPCGNASYYNQQGFPSQMQQPQYMNPYQMPNSLPMPNMPQENMINADGQQNMNPNSYTQAVNQNPGMNPNPYFTNNPYYQNPNQMNNSLSEQLNAELASLKAALSAIEKNTEAQPKMTLDEFLNKQKEIKEAKEQKRRQNFRIVGSRGKVNASALDGGVYVAGNKVYKWGDTKILDK